MQLDVTTYPTPNGSFPSDPPLRGAALPCQLARNVIDRTPADRFCADHATVHRDGRGHDPLRIGTDQAAGDRCAGAARPLPPQPAVRARRSVAVEGESGGVAPAPAHYDPPHWAGSLASDTCIDQRWWRRSILRAVEEPECGVRREVGQRPPPPFDLPDTFAPLETVEDDPLYHLINRAIVAVTILALLGIAAQLLRAWIGGAL